jgi:hypothetical protein
MRIDVKNLDSFVHRGWVIVELSAAKLLAWGNYRVITPTHNSDLVTGERRPEHGVKTIHKVNHRKDGLTTIVVAHNGVPAANSYVCAKDSYAVVHKA